jgi:formate dehydrogenase subunit delta
MIEHRDEMLAKLIRMANQIATAFQGVDDDVAAASVDDHIKLYWTPKMREDLSNWVAAGGRGLGPIALRAFMNAERTTSDDGK